MILFKTVCKDMPMFNQIVYTSDQMNDANSLGRIDEILGRSNQFMLTVIPKEGIAPKSVKDSTKIYLDRNFFLPMATFTNPSRTKRVSKRGRGGRGFSRGGGRGFSRGRGGYSGGRGSSRGYSRGGGGGGYGRGQSRSYGGRGRY